MTITDRYRARLLPEPRVLTVDPHERGPSGRFRRCATPECGLKLARHFKYRKRRGYSPLCDTCRGVGGDRRRNPRCVCGCGRRVARASNGTWRRTATAECETRRVVLGARRSGAAGALRARLRRLRFFAVHGDLSQRLAARAELGRQERKRQQALERAAARRTEAA